MKDFIIVIPHSWSSVVMGSLSRKEAVIEHDDKVHFLIENCEVKTPQSGQWEMNIDYFGCSVEKASFNQAQFVKDRIDTIDFSYYFHVDSEIKLIRAASCLFSILPIYYYQGSTAMILSNHASLIVEHIDKRWSVSAKYLVEQALFNYSFHNETLYEGIKLLPTNTLLKIGAKIEFVKYLEITEYYCDAPSSIKKSIEPLRDFFIEESKKYFGIDKSAISFTSGYDGRTLLACSRYHGRKFDAYSFGAEDNDDIYVPRSTAKKLGIPFKAIVLNENYAKNDYFSTGNELMDLTDGNNTLLQVHHLYAAKQMAKDHDCLLNGMFGSELFRALHISGQVTSRELVSIFTSDDISALKDNLKKSSKLLYFHPDRIIQAMNTVMENVIEYKLELMRSGLTKNQQFYKFIFEEAFRKYFGYIIAPQLRFINVHSPFLNLNFMRELFKSELSGVNNDFFTHNPIKRFKGQLLYAKIIEKADKALFQENTTKGYSPQDLLSLTGRIRVGFGYIKKKLKRKIGQSELNNLMIINGIQSNGSRFSSTNIHPIYASDSINAILGSNLHSPDRDLKVQCLSMINFISRAMES